MLYSVSRVRLIMLNKTCASELRVGLHAVSVMVVHLQSRLGFIDTLQKCFYINTPIIYVHHALGISYAATSEISDGVWNLESSLPAKAVLPYWPSWCTMLFEATAHTTDFHASSRDIVSRQTHFSICLHTLARPLAWSCTAVKRKTSCRYWWLKTANSGLYSTHPYRNVIMHYDFLSITRADLYWNTWQPSRRCHIQNVKINRNDDGHGDVPTSITLP